jgi:hypothetical protein
MVLKGLLRAHLRIHCINLMEIHRYTTQVLRTLIEDAERSTSPDEVHRLPRYTASKASPSSLEVFTSYVWTRAPLNMSWSTCTCVQIHPRVFRKRDYFAVRAGSKHVGGPHFVDYFQRSIPTSLRDSRIRKVRGAFAACLPGLMWILS